MIRSLLLALFLLLPLPAAAQTLEGSWVLQVEGTAILRFDLEPAGKRGEWRATWSKPSFYASDGNRFAKLTGPPEQVKSSGGIEVGDQVELSFDDPRPGAVPDVFRFRLVGPDTAELVYVGTGLAPYTLNRVAAGARIGPWDPEKVYTRTPPAPSADDFSLPPGR